MVYVTYNYSYWGESKPTYNWGGHMVGKNLPAFSSNSWLVVEPYPSEKYELVKWDDDIPKLQSRLVWDVPKDGNIKHVPNHQPDRVSRMGCRFLLVQTCSDLPEISGADVMDGHVHGPQIEQVVQQCTHHDTLIYMNYTWRVSDSYTILTIVMYTYTCIYFFGPCF